MENGFTIANFGRGWNSASCGAFITKNEQSYVSYGIGPGAVSMERDYGTPALLWISPTSSTYSIYLLVGGSTSSGGGGVGNVHAQT